MEKPSILEIDGFTIEKTFIATRYTCYNFVLKNEIVGMLSIGQNSYCNRDDNILPDPILV